LHASDEAPTPPHVLTRARLKVTRFDENPLRAKASGAAALLLMRRNGGRVRLVAGVAERGFEAGEFSWVADPVAVAKRARAGIGVWRTRVQMGDDDTAGAAGVPRVTIA
jgi:hypothetical protein